MPWVHTGAIGPWFQMRMERRSEEKTCGGRIALLFKLDISRQAGTRALPQRNNQTRELGGSAACPLPRPTRTVTQLTLPLNMCKFKHERHAIKAIEGLGGGGQQCKLAPQIRRNTDPESKCTLPGPVRRQSHYLRATQLRRLSSGSLGRLLVSCRSCAEVIAFLRLHSWVGDHAVPRRRRRLQTLQGGRAGSRCAGGDLPGGPVEGSRKLLTSTQKLARKKVPRGTHAELRG